MGNFCPHMVQLLSEWMETFPYDFRDERVMQHVRQLTQRCVALDPSLRRDVSQMLHNLLHRLTALEKYEEFLEKINTEASAALIDTLNAVRSHHSIKTKNDMIKHCQVRVIETLLLSGF